MPNVRKSDAAVLCGLLSGVTVLTLLGKLGDASGPGLVTTRPLLLLALNANDLHCVLTSSTAALGTANAPSSLAWFLVALVRRLAEDPLFFALGWAYKDHPSLEWIRALAPDVIPLAPAADTSDDRKIHSPGVAQSVWSRRVSRLAVVLEPGAVVCAAAGATRMPPVEFALINVCGTCARLVCLRSLGAAFPGPLSYVLGLIQRYRTLLLALALAGAGLATAGLTRRLYAVRKKKSHVD